MAELIWTVPALQDLDAIADYIALDNPLAARRLVQRVFQHVAQLEAYPESGSHPPELRRSSHRYRQIVEPPCRSSTATSVPLRECLCSTSCAQRCFFASAVWASGIATIQRPNACSGPNILPPSVPSPAARFERCWKATGAADARKRGCGSVGWLSKSAPMKSARRIL